jgi:beta-lactamase regulating signal transducer with metallopeptidase domain
MTPLELHSLAQLLTARMLNSAAAGVLLTALVWAALRLSRRQNSGTRFAVWSLALVAVVSLPFFGGAGAAGAPAALHPVPKLATAIVLSGSWALYLFAAWAAGATFLLLRLAVGLWHLHRLRSRCTQAEASSLVPETAALLRSPRHGGPVTLCLSTEVTAPAVVGFFRPVIAFPTWLLPQLSTAELEIILLHEMAHLRRRDQWTNLFQKLLKALFFFHPAVWWIENRLTLEREMACDDMVLAHRASPRAYASVLITLAEKLHSAPVLALAQALFGRMRQMSLRVSQILDAGRPKGTATRKPVFSAGAVLLLLAVGAAPYMPNLVAFRSPAPPDAVLPPQVASRVPAVDVVKTALGTDSGAPATPFTKDQKPAMAALRDVPPAPATRPAQVEADAAADVHSHEFQAKAATETSEVASAYRARNAATANTAVPAPASAPQMPPDAVPQLATAPPATIVIIETTLVRDEVSGEWVVRIWTVERDKDMARQLESALGLRI